MYVEGVIYQVDEDNEQATAAPLAAEQPGHARLEAMQQVLRERGLLTAGVQRELAAGQQYWHEERRLCGLMLQQPTVPAGGHGEACGFTLQEALRVSEAKSFDYRLLHLLLYALRRADPSPDDALLLRFLRVDELLVDIGAPGCAARACGCAAFLPWARAWSPPAMVLDVLCVRPTRASLGPRHLHATNPGDDLTDYEDDIDAGGGGGSFNILRAYVHLFGREAPLRLAERVGELERQREELLARLPPQQQQHVRQRQVQAADGGGGGLRWQLPPVILDEQAFRRQFAG